MTSAPKPHIQDSLAFDIAGGPAAGTVTLDPDGAFTYSSRHGATAEATGGGVDDTFEVTVNDAHGNVVTVPVGVATGPTGLSGMSLTVSDPDETTGAVTVSVTITGPESDPVVYLVVHDPSYGTLVPGPTGGLIYTPNPQARAAAADRGPDTDQFEIAAYDYRGRSATIPVSVEINPHAGAASVTAAHSAVSNDLDSWQLVHAAPGALIYAAPMTASPTGAPLHRATRGWQPSGSPAEQPQPGRSHDHSALDYAGYLGRAGLLAVALGVGAALARTPGVAWAEPTDTDSDTSSTSTSASTQGETSTTQSGASSTSTATRLGTGSTDTSTGTSTTTTGAGPTVTVSSSGGAQTSTTATSETSATTTTSPSSTGSPSQTSTTVSAPGSTSPPVTVSSSGGAQTSTGTAPVKPPTVEAAPTVSAPTPQRPAEPTAPAASVAEAAITPAVTAPQSTTQEAPKAPVTDATAEAPEAPVTDATPHTPPESRHTAPTAPSDAPRAPSVTSAAPVAAPSAAQRAGAPLRVPTVLSAPTSVTTAADTTAPPAAATRTGTPTAADTTTTATEAAAPSAAPVTPFPAVNRVISAVLSPLSAPAVTTAQTPVLFGVFSWIRRTFFTQTPTLAYDPSTTTQVDNKITGKLTAADADGPTPALTVTDAPDHGTVTAGDAAAAGVSEHTSSQSGGSLPVTQPDGVRSSTLLAGGGLTAAPTAAVTTTTYPSTTRNPVAVSTNTAFIEYVTGPGNLNQTNTRFNIGGTDLGIMWDNGIQDDPTTTVSEHQVLIAFGDTFANSYPVRTGLWRMNTLLRTPDNTLSNGLYVPNTAPGDIYSGSSTIGPYDPKEIVDRNNIAGYAMGPEVTIIPTAGTSVPGAGVNGATRQYVNFMSVRAWGTAGRWTTNYSGIAYSDDNGQTWQVAPSSIRPSAAGYSTTPFVSGNQNFQQGAYVKGIVKDASGNAVYDPATGQLKTDGYVYSYGTPAGRGGTVYLSRVKETDILDQTKYEYWSGTTKTWVANKPSAATPILPGTTSGWFIRTTTYPSAGEMSVQYNEYEKKYLMLYADKNNNVVMRKADNPQGPWSAPTTLVTSARMPGLYAPMIHPWSSTQNVPTAERHYLYWNMSTWGDYEVRLMRTDLDKV